MKLNSCQIQSSGDQENQIYSFAVVFISRLHQIAKKQRTSVLSQDDHIMFVTLEAITPLLK